MRFSLPPFFQFYEVFVETSNLFFTAVFVIEVTIRLIAAGCSRYLKDRYVELSNIAKFNRWHALLRNTGKSCPTSLLSSITSSLTAYKVRERGNKAYSLHFKSVILVYESLSLTRNLQCRIKYFLQNCTIIIITRFQSQFKMSVLAKFCVDVWQEQVQKHVWFIYLRWKRDKIYQGNKFKNHCFFPKTFFRAVRKPVHSWQYLENQAYIIRKTWFRQILLNFSKLSLSP